VPVVKKEGHIPSPATINVNMNNKRKNRAGPTLGRSERVAQSSGPAQAPSKHHTNKTPDKEHSPNDSSEFVGIYSNARFTHALTSLIGVHLRVETKNKDEYEGIFKTFSPDLEIVLELTHKVDPNNPDTVELKNVEEKMVFPLSSVVRYFATDVDMEFAMKESFLTDSQIIQTKTNGEAPMRELEMWMPEEDSAGGGGIEERFGLKTSYDPNMSAYTVPLNRDRDSEAEAKASRIAAFIEEDGKSRANLDLENGDEEEAFSAVVRPNDRRNGRDRESGTDDKSSAYVPPGKRDMRSGYSRGRGQRTPPPSRYDSYEERDHRQRDDRRDRYSGSRSGHRDERGYGNPQDRERGHSQQGVSGYHQQQGHREDRSSYGGREERMSNYGRQDSRGSYATQQHDQQQRSGNFSHDQSRGAGFQQRPQSSHDNRREERKSAEKISPCPNNESTDKSDALRKSVGEMGNTAGGRQSLPSESVTEAGLPQREGSRRKLEKTKEQSSTELHDFHQKFNLKLCEGGPPPLLPPPPSGASPSTQANTVPPNTPPTVSINSDDINGVALGPTISPSGGSAGVSTPSPAPNSVSSGPHPSLIRDGNGTPTGSCRPLAQQQQPQQQAQKHQLPPTQTAMLPPPSTVVPAASAGSTPPAACTSSSPDSAQKKSLLNPNAKEFTLNPGAKEFTPRGVTVLAPRPSATPPRPQTPGTPGQMTPNMYANILPIQNQAVPQQIGSISGAAPFTPANNGRPLRPNSKEGGHHRPDLPSPMQVQQVTGQPILAQQLHPPGYFPQGQMQYVPGPGQPHIMRMVMPQGIMPGNLVHVPLSTHGTIAGQGGSGAVASAVPDQNQQFVPTSQYQNSPAAPPQMWTTQVMSMSTPTGGPNQPQQQQQQQGHSGMAPTPPAPSHHTPAPSPGPQIIGYAAQQGHSQPNSLPQYPMIIMPSGPGLPQFHQTATPISAPPIAPIAGTAQPVTSLPNMAQHFPYVQGRGGQPIQMMAPNHHQQ